MDISNWFRTKHSNLNYFVVFTLFSIIGILLIVLFDYVLDFLFMYCPHLDLPMIYSQYISSDIPRIHSQFFYILKTNLFSAIATIFVPFLAVGIFTAIVYIVVTISKLDSITKIEKELLSNFTFFHEQILFPLTRVLICLVAIGWGIRTFNNLYCNIKLFPVQIFLSQYPHAIIELPTFIGAGCLAFIMIDKFEESLKKIDNVTPRKLGDTLISSLRCVYPYIIFILVCIFIAAVIETWITPYVFANSLGSYLNIIQ